VIVECPSCYARFTVPDAALGTSGRTVRCSKCKHAWHQNPEIAAEIVPPLTVDHAPEIVSETPFIPVSASELATPAAYVAPDGSSIPAAQRIVEPEIKFELPDFSSEASQAMDALDRPSENDPVAATAQPEPNDDDADSGDAEPKDFIAQLPPADDETAMEHLSHLQTHAKKALLPLRGAPIALKIAASIVLICAVLLGLVVNRGPIAHAAPWTSGILSMLGSAPAEGLMFSDVAYHREPSERGARISIGCAVRNMSREPLPLPNMRLQLFNRANEKLIEEDNLLAPIPSIAPGDVAPCDIPVMNLRSGTADKFVLDVGSSMDLMTREAP
jgi:predicted Zn finger-like uncharacterized protein